MHTLNSILAHAVEQYGLDRSYTIKFDTNNQSPRILISEDDTLLGTVWLDDGKMYSKFYYLS
jgi:hypothetical protein